MFSVITITIPVIKLPVQATWYGANGKFLSPILPIEELPNFSEYTEIRDRAGLEAIKNNLSGKYYLSADIDLLGAEWEPIGESISNPFTGTLDGQGHIIRNLKITSGDKWCGLFGVAGEYSAIIKNIALEDTYINVKSDYDYVHASAGGICGGGVGTWIIDCYCLDLYGFEYGTELTVE